MNNNSMADRYGYVRDPSALCHGAGCQSRTLIATADRAMAQNAELLEHIGRKEAMMTPAEYAGGQQRIEPARALWCELGGHSFGERDPGMRVLAMAGVDDAGAPVTDSLTVCGACAPKVGARLTRPAELAPPPPPYKYDTPAPADPAYALRDQAAAAGAVPPAWDAQGDSGPRL